ncbi:MULTISPECIES: hypothetical protein [Brevibacillus]|uniref:Uncharacterized protein n=1 Tax=Brevibacillus porteri TaxID=2126350 RepID=A0ABX5FTV7_9BACL|nr:MULTISPECIES: hypothetical protein [Brevibacillus]MCM3143840.1 hypothetical protein [Brevibacillus sp. MER 51]MED1801349.1 hypothetical protein [Brevibacillus porteri]MED2135056.1 hypothetical protein [Brevibacillus porteri]MED2747367.1 hypothetical protein [Brevibacillus porteri]MED2813447.1 hypothetical protein [Brevibacillus porteri]
MARNPEKKRCKARSKQRDEQCKNWAKPGWDVCRFHGAGGGAPERNTNAVKTGEFQSIWMDALTPEQAEVLDRINLDPVQQADEEIRLFTWREREMMLRIRDLKDGLTEKQRRVLQQRVTTKEPVQVHDDKSGKQKMMVITRDELVTTEIEETEYRAIEDILSLEEALTRVQDKKLKAIQLKAQLLSNGGGPEKQITVRRWSRDKSGT